MSGFIQGEDRSQATLFPERLDDYVAEDSSVRVIDVFIDELDLSGMGFKTQPNETGRPAYHPTTMLKIFVYGYHGTQLIHLSVVIGIWCIFIIPYSTIVCDSA